MAFENDTIADDAAKHVGENDSQPGSGNATAPGGSAAPERSTEHETHGQETYPGSRPGGAAGQATDASYGGNGGAPAETAPGSDETVARTGDALTGGTLNGDAGVNSRATGGGLEEVGNETGLNGDTPAAGDVDPDATLSAEETGQDGDPREPQKSTGHPWNG